MYVFWNAQNLNIFLYWISYIQAQTSYKSPYNISDAVQINRKKNNLYDKKRSHDFDSVKIKSDIEFEKSYEVKKIIKKKIKKYEKISIIQYLIRWFNYKSEYDKWKNLATLINCINLIHDYEKNKTALIKKKWTKNFDKKTTRNLQTHQMKNSKKKQIKKTVSKQLMKWINQLLSIF